MKNILLVILVLFTGLQVVAQEKNILKRIVFMYLFK